VSIDQLDSRSARVAQRSRCTGETTNMVRRQIKSESEPLMPEATSDGQLDLEAALLLASNRAMRSMIGRRPPTEGAPFINRVRLAARELSLEVADDAVTRFLAEALPSVVGDQVRGIAGLRPQPGRNHLDLQLIGFGGDMQGEVRLRGVGKEQWRAAADVLRASDRADVRPWLECRDNLHEREYERLRHRPAQPTELMSAVLRRFPLWRGAAWLDSAVVGNSLHMRWRAGPEERAIASMLSDSACGVPGAAVASRQVSNTIRSILLSRKGLISQGLSDSEESRIWPEYATSDSHTKQSVNAEVWRMSDMRRALSERDISSVYRLLRRVGVSERQIAGLTGQSTVEVAEVIGGRRVSERSDLARIAAGLGVPPAYLGLTADEVIAHHNAPPEWDDEETKRRRFLMHAAAVCAGTTVLGVGDALGGIWRDQSRQFVDRALTDRERRAVEAARSALRSAEQRERDRER
jgi:transcriptional regulator with XRE-family HTH domain